MNNSQLALKIVAVPCGGRTEGNLEISDSFPKPKTKGRRKSMPAPQQGHAPKRAKLHQLFDDIPPVQDGVISASKTPIFDETRRVDMPIENVSIEEAGSFFEDPTTRLHSVPCVEMAPYVKRTLNSWWASEETLRNAVYTDLKCNHGVQFPESCLQEDTGIARVLRKAIGRETLKCNKTDLSDLMAECGRQRGHSSTNMRRIMRGLPVTTTSKPDLSPLDSRGESVQIRFGEFKNAPNYSANSARSQCIMYLLGLLHWLRTKLGEPVDAVHGFCFCGRRCADQNQTYCVGLVKLTAPMCLGDELRAKFVQVTDDATSPIPMNALIHFLKHGKRWSISSSTCGEDGLIEAHRRVPSLFTLPSSLWKDDEENR